MERMGLLLAGGDGTMKVAICDDEVVCRQILRERILRDGICQGYETEIAEYADGSTLLEAVEEGYCAEVYFLDIETREGADDGIRTARELRRCGDQGLIVYVTGFLDYVQTGYEVRAFRYLLKSQIDRDLGKVLLDIRRELAGEGFFSFQRNKETLRVKLQDILYMESDRRLVRIWCRQGEESFYGSLDKVEESLEGKGFLRCHKSYLVNMERVKTFSGEQVVLEEGTVLPVSRAYGKEVKRELTLYFSR